MKVTISDVAKRAGVSKSTVSQYLNGRFSFMSEETQQKIKLTIEELNYVPNEIARSLTHKKSNTVGIIVSNISSQFTIDLVRGVERELEQQNIQLLLCNTDNDPARERQYLISLSARQVDGVILFPNSENIEIYEELYKSKFPLVFVDRNIKSLNIPSITLNNELATELATQNLINEGHENIALMTFPYQKSGMSNRQGRVKGYLETLKSNEIVNGNKYLFEINEDDITKTLEKITSDKEITGLVLTNDILLEEFLIFSKQNSINIPKDISVISIDDASFARFNTPTITTIKQPANEIGKMSAQVMLGLINGGKKDLKDIKELSYEFKPELRLRESVKKIK